MLHLVPRQVDHWWVPEVGVGERESNTFLSLSNSAGPKNAAQQSKRIQQKSLGRPERRTGIGSGWSHALLTPGEGEGERRTR